ncbi:DUF4221 family protein [Pleomorphovibrio marinus]|uniref:DUF4221 family protein n=1 Tax=Pleomorphovibrio marinus TaxID=2164132 RepID=UPI000E0ACC55|nr:DUF4221 family protein [Pleomorphovibrio marinus]
MNATLSSLTPVSDRAICKPPISSFISHSRWYCLLFILLGWTSVSCQRGNNEQHTEVMSYSVDTILIDAKDRILDIGGYMNVSDLDNDGKSFFLYNHHDHFIDEINLDTKEFVKAFPLEAEGPNGVGQYVFGLQCLEDNLLFLKTGPSSAVIDNNGRVVQKVNWLTAKDSVGDAFGEVPPRMEVVVDTKDWLVMGTNLDFLKSTAFLGVLSVEENLVKNIDVDTEKSFSNYFLKFENNFRPPWVFLRADENYAYLSHEYSNEIFLFHSKGELVKVVHYEPKLTPARAKAPEILTSTREKVRRESRKLMEQVRFEAPVWDKVNRRYFRLSAKRIFEDGPEDEILPIKRTHIFLSVFDAEFNLVSEIELKELFAEQFKYFAKDGKLWVCQNFSDELGFLVFEF